MYPHRTFQTEPGFQKWEAVLVDNRVVWHTDYEVCIVEDANNRDLANYCSC